MPQEIADLRGPFKNQQSRNEQNNQSDLYLPRGRDKKNQIQSEDRNRDEAWDDLVDIASKYQTLLAELDVHESNLELQTPEPST